MSRNQKKVPASDSMLLMIIMLNVVAIKTAYIYSHNYFWAVLLLLPLFLAMVNINRRKNSSENNSSDILN